MSILVGESIKILELCLGSFRASVQCVGYAYYTLIVYIFRRKTGVLMT